MKRHIIFIGTLSNGGAERVVSILAGKMAEKGMDVEILTYYDAPVSYKLHPQVKLTCVEKETGKGGKLQNILWLRKYFENNALVVISFLAPFNMLAIAANLYTGVPIIVADRNDPGKVPSNWILRKGRNLLYCFADRVIVQTKKNQQYFCNKIQKKSAVIYNPIHMDAYIGTALGTEKGKKIVSVGRLTAQKNQKLLIRAFAAILKNYPQHVLEIYGAGELKEELQSLSRELGIEEQVALPGNVSKVHDAIKTAEMFVLSSDYEGMPNALLEAMCMGLPCISTKVSGATDLIEDHKNGILTEIGNQKELENAMLELLENQELAVKLGKNAADISRQLELSKIVDQWIDLINQAVMRK